MSSRSGSRTGTGAPKSYSMVVDVTDVPPAVPLAKRKRWRTLRSRPASSRNASKATTSVVKPFSAAVSAGRTAGDAARAAAPMSVVPLKCRTGTPSSRSRPSYVTSRTSVSYTHL